MGRLQSIGELDRETVSRCLRGDGLSIRTGPFVTRIRSRCDEIAQGVATNYALHRTVPAAAFADFDVSVERASGPRRWVKPLVEFHFDGHRPFAPLPAHHAYPLLEWALNWTISAHAHQYLVVHAAVLERGGRALVMPAPPGSGKSTLCTALAFSGWRLLSDELLVLDPVTRLAVPLARPISLKNSSIDLIRSRLPSATMSPEVPDTMKGRVAHLRPPEDAVRRQHEAARPAWVMLPKYVPTSPAALEPHGKARTLMRLAESTFNYSVYGAEGFEILADMVSECECLEFRYSRLDDALECLDALARP